MGANCRPLSSSVSTRGAADRQEAGRGRAARGKPRSCSKPVRTSGFPGFGTDKPAGLVTGRDTVQIPDTERTQIEAALKRAGRPLPMPQSGPVPGAQPHPQRTAQN